MIIQAQNFILTSKCNCADGCKDKPHHDQKSNKSKINPGYIGIAVLAGYAH